MTAIPTIFRTAKPSRDFAPLAGFDIEHMRFLAERRVRKEKESSK